MATWSFHIFIRGKVEVGIYFCVTADIMTKVLLKCFWSSPLPIVWILSKSLILIGGHGNRNAKIFCMHIYSILAEYSLHSCTFRWALWSMGLWFTRCSCKKITKFVRLSKNIFSVTNRGARWLSGRVSDSGARGPGFETYRRRVVSLSKTLYSPKVLVNYPGSDGSVPTWLKNCWLGR